MASREPWVSPRAVLGPNLLAFIRIESLRVVLGWPWGSLGVALGCLCTPESMPSIWPWGGLGVALGGLSVQGSGFNVQGSMLDVLPITFVHSFPARRAARSEE